MTLAAHIVQSLVLYAVAEHQAGHARQLQVEFDGATFGVADDGRGHAIDRAVEGTPYLKLIYEQLQYPFGLAQPGPVQLQGIAMSLINTLCSELEVWVRRPQAGLHLHFVDGALCTHEHLAGPIDDTGNRIRGRLQPALRSDGTESAEIGAWLRALQRAAPGLGIRFNGAALAAEGRAPGAIEPDTSP